MDKKIKSLSVSSQKSADVNGEHRITFVASSANIDRDSEIVEIDSFYLPLKGGGKVQVKELPVDGHNAVDVPFMANHDLWDVTQTLGSVRNAKFVNGELIFEVGISERELAQDLFKLVNEGHLDNAFSIQWRGGASVRDENDIPHYSEGEILEVSLVGRGANPDARVLATKAVKEESMDETVNTAPVEAAPAEAHAEATTPVEAAVETPADPVGKTEETPVENKVEETTETPVEKQVKTEKEKKMGDEISKTLIKEQPSQAKTTPANSNYLKSKSAMHDFAKMIADNRGMRSEQIMKMWSDSLVAKGVTGDTILPARLEQIFFKSWTDNDGILSTFRHVGINAGAVYAFTGEGEGIRAKGHKKGQVKAEQVIANIRRDIKSILVYKKLGIDLQDLLDDQTGEILRFRAEELAGRVYHEIAVAAILGDGRTAPTGSNPDYRVFDGTRGLFSMAADIAGSKTAGSYAAIVANEVANVATDNAYDKAIKTLAQVKDEGRGKILVVPTGWEAQIRLAKDANGAYLFQPGVDVKNILGVAGFYELDEMKDSGYDAIAYANGAYALFGTGAMTRTDFDLSTNTDVMLFEKPAAGSLYGQRAAAGYVAEAES